MITWTALQIFQALFGAVANYEVLSAVKFLGFFEILVELASIPFGIGYLVYLKVKKS